MSSTFNGAIATMRATQANADRALDLQIKHQNLPGALV